jgi:hypothetical protein
MVDSMLVLHLASLWNLVSTWIHHNYNMTNFHLLSQILGLLNVLCEMQVQNYLNLIWIRLDIVE